MRRTLLASGALLLAPGCVASPGPPAAGEVRAVPSTADPAPDARVRVAVPIRNEDLHLEIRAAPPASARDPGPPGKANGLVRLCRDDGRVAGPAAPGARARSPGSSRDDWAAEFAHGEEVELLFRRESDGMYWRVVVVPSFTADGIRWTVRDAGLLCIR